MIQDRLFIPEKKYAFSGSSDERILKSKLNCESLGVHNELINNENYFTEETSLNTFIQDLLK